ncbi:Gfo/Idh/MocA family protein [Sporosarcina gallistercoris]|uniref:Gfo/Idh/MocA family oxidoreductase n=1 Tax=Sporosarcina gallistercoris TaxID=2762245 RepID=A0ABR8PJ35_9BACL|nr:Gfo/Idh/MocA family oxidoreductase [Sporosarcina gallistercoris]MBD7908167.1 Gfo/Idh/MocA family oxidoreductase [Sporosarcina gallistercoris]
MVRIGLVGTNWITERLLDSAAHVDNLSVAAVYSRTSARAEEFASKHGIPHQFTTIEEMAASDKIDAVYIATPNSFHAPQAILFLQNGKHVLCEKPLAANSNEVQRMFETAKKHNVLLMEAMKSTLLPNFKVIQDNIHKLGPIRKYFASFCQYSSRYDQYKEGTVLNAFNPKFANGALMDLGVYCLYPLIALFGEPLEVKATGTLLESGVDSSGSVTLKYEEKDAVLMYSKVSNSALPWEIQGEKGTMLITKVSSPEHVEIHYHDGRIESLTVEMPYPSMYYEIREFVDLIEQGKNESDVNTYFNSFTTMKVADAIRKNIGLEFPSDLH